MNNEKLEYNYVVELLPYCALSLVFIFVCAGVYMNYKLNKMRKIKKRK